MVWQRAAKYCRLKKHYAKIEYEIAKIERARTECRKLKEHKPNQNMLLKYGVGVCCTKYVWEFAELLKYSVIATKKEYVWNMEVQKKSVRMQI